MAKKKSNEPDMEWDVSDIIEEAVQDRLDNPEDYELEDIQGDEEAIRKLVYEDTFLIQDQWEFFTEALGEHLEELNKSGYWNASVEGFGWRSQSGAKIFRSDADPDKFLGNILPDTDCTFKIWISKRPAQIKIQNFHHDSPTGREWYYITPMSNREVEKAERDGDL